MEAIAESCIFDQIELGLRDDHVRRQFNVQLTRFHTPRRAQRRAVQVTSNKTVFMS